MAALVRPCADMSAPDLLRDGLAAYARGQIDVAIETFARAAAQSPDVADAHHLLGAALSGAGRDAEALAPLERAVALGPGVGAYRGALALCLKGLGRMDEARKTFDAARALAPGDVAIAFNRANALAGGAAIAAYGEVLALDPAHAGARLNRANALARAGREAEAAAEFAALPDDARALTGLAGVRLRLGDPARAREAALAAVRLAPGSADAWLNLGAASGLLGRIDEALDALSRAPPGPETAVARAAALIQVRRFADALAAIEAAGADHFEARVARGNAEFGLNRPASAARAFDLALAQRPGDPAATVNRANIALYCADAARAVGLLTALRAKAPDDPSVAAAWLYALNYDDRTTPETLLAAHRAWGAAFPDPQHPAYIGKARPRIGYVSADLCGHSVAWVLRAVLPHHDRGRFEIQAFSSVAVEDATTSVLKSHFDAWHDIAVLHDDAAADLVRKHGIDLLIDLSGHTAGRRLGVFARRPAQMQATWLGYPATTGLPAMDWRIVDAVSDPGDGGMSERPMRVAGGFLAYAPSRDASLRARERSGGPVFGSFNNLAKLSPATLALWARLLRETPAAKLMLKARSLADPEVRAGIAARFAGHGVDPARLAMRGWVQDALAAYAEIDVALDPLPYNGTITSFETLWMGVPLVSLPGRTHAARVGASILTHGGFADWIAHDEDAYIEIARRLADAPPDRAGIRAALSASPLFDGARLARAIEALTAGP
jgi:protein O-GlcNAc transferase